MLFDSAKFATFIFILLILETSASPTSPSPTSPSPQESRPAIVINEIDTKNGQYLEIANVGDRVVDLHGQAIVFAELGSKGTQSLKVRAAVSLSGTSLAPDELAVISNGHLEGIGITDIIPSGPNKHWKVFSNDIYGHEWLKVKEKNILAAFLINSPNDDVFEFFKKDSSKGHLWLDGDRKNYVKQFLSDYIVVSESKATQKCHLVDEIVQEDNFQRTVLDLFLDEHSGDSSYQYLSLNRCESIKPKDLRSFKHGRPRKTSFYRQLKILSVFGS